MSNIIKWLAAISNEDGDKISYGSHSTLNLIRKEANRIQDENTMLRKALEMIEGYASDCCFDSHTQMKEAIENVLAQTEAVKLLL